MEYLKDIFTGFIYHIHRRQMCAIYLYLYYMIPKPSVTPVCLHYVTYG